MTTFLLSRLIPAGAGQIHDLRDLRVGEWAHPRRCGADLTAGQWADLSAGSSPQVRGRWVERCNAVDLLGLIPAGAGQIPLPLLRETNGRAHPRRCGADGVDVESEFVEAGSSPQVRGRSAN